MSTNTNPTALSLAVIIKASDVLLAGSMTPHPLTAETMNAYGLLRDAVQELGRKNGNPYRDLLTLATELGR